MFSRPCLWTVHASWFVSYRLTDSVLFSLSWSSAMMKIIYLGDMIPNWFYPRVSEPTIFFLSSFLIDVGWFNLPDEKNCNVYVTGLPLDITDEEFEELMVKYGIISPDPNDTRKKKIRLYRDEQGKPKGDGRCRFLRVRSPRIFFVGERTNKWL